MEQYLKYLSSEVDFNIDIYNQIQQLKDNKSLYLSLQDTIFNFKLTLDIIHLNDQNLDVSIYVQQNYPYLDSIVRNYVFSIFEKESWIKNLNVQREQILIDIDVINGNFSSSLSIYLQKNILSKQEKNDYSLSGELVLIDYFQVLKIFPTENYFSLRRYQYRCGCFQESKLVNKNLITHFTENTFDKIPQCEECRQDMVEEKDKNKVEVCQKILVYIPQKKNSQTTSSKGLYFMYVQKQYCNQLKINQTYSCIAYYSLQYSYKQYTKKKFIQGYKEVEIREHLFADTISSVLKGKNKLFQDNIINQIQYCCKNMNEFQNNDDETNFHFRFKQMMFGVDSFFDNDQSTRFSFLHLKTALVLSYVLNNSQSLLNEFQLTFNHSEYLNILFSCESSLIENIINIVTNSFNALNDFDVFDCLLQTDLTSALIKSNNGILLIKNLQDISKQQIEVLHNMILYQEVYVDQLKTKVNLKCTLWAFMAVNDGDQKTKKFKNTFNSNSQQSPLHNLEQLFDISLSHDKSLLSLKDYQNTLQNESELYLKKELMNNQLIEHRNPHELSTAKKNQISKDYPLKEEISTLKKQKGNQLNVDNDVNQQNIQQNEEQAYELLHGFVNTIRNNVRDNNNIIYSTNNISSLSKFAIASSLFSNIYVQQNNPNLFLASDKQEESQRVIIDVFDSFLSIFFNILSRKVFSNEIDTKYFLSFIINYGVGYEDNPDMIIPQEKEFYNALEKIQDQVVEYINF